MSGLEYYSTSDFQHIIVSSVETGSPAGDIGIEKGDEIISFNCRPVNNMALQGLDAIFESGDNRSIFCKFNTIKNTAM